MSDIYSPLINFSLESFSLVIRLKIVQFPSATNLPPLLMSSVDIGGILG